MLRTVRAARKATQVGARDDTLSRGIETGMTVIVNTIWGNRISQIVDRQISQRGPGDSASVVDTLSTKACVVLCSNALVSIAYTGIAVAHQRWMDTVVASCLAHRELDTAMIQPGAIYLARPIHTIIHELSINLNGRLNSDARARGADLRLSVIGWHLGNEPRPFSWELVRGAEQDNGRRYFTIIRHPAGKFLRQHPRGLWAETLGDVGRTVDDGVRSLERTEGFTHDDVERHIKNVITERATETVTVGGESLAIQLDPFDSEGQVQITRYPSPDSQDAALLMTCWVLTPRLICSPGNESTYGCSYSPCGHYLTSGFSDGNTNLKVRTRLPLETAHFGGLAVLAYGTQKRCPTA